MYEISVSSEFCAAHHLRGYEGKCSYVHGHNWRVEVIVVSDKLNSQGMLIDFERLKLLLSTLLMGLDHKYLNELTIFEATNPTSEVIAEYLYHQMKKAIGGEYSIKTKVWETSDCYGAYWE